MEVDNHHHRLAHVMTRSRDSNCAPQPPPPASHGAQKLTSPSAPSLARTAALHEFHGLASTQRDRVASYSFAIGFSIAPPAPSDECAHESALSFAFADEVQVVRQLQLKHREGTALVRDIYCARNCARALPPVPPDASAAQTTAYYTTVIAVLQPQVEKIRALGDFCSQTVVMLSDNVQRITVHENTTRVIPDVLMDALLDLMDVVLQLNQLHDSKSSLRNDFSVYKRAFQIMRGQLQDGERVEKDLLRLQDFVSGSKGSIWDSLRHNLTNVKRQCLSHIEDDICLTPEQRFKYIRVLPSLLVVLEESRQSAKANGIRAMEKKAMEAAAKVLQRYPVVPMLGELSAMRIGAFQTASGGKKDGASAEHEKQIDAAFDLLAVSAKMKSVCGGFLPRLVHVVNAHPRGDGSLEQNAALYSVVLEALGHLSEWKSSLLLFVALKFQFPASNDALQRGGACLDSPYLEYERATRYNYTGDELSAVTDVVHCTKAVVHILRSHAVSIAACVRRHVYQRTQQFVQHTALPLLHRAHKRKLVSTKLLQDVRMTCADWNDVKATTVDYLQRRKDRRFPILGDRTAAPTLSQIRMLRTLVNAVYAKRSMADLNAKHSAAASFFSYKKELESSDIELLQRFYSEASVFAGMLSHDEIASELSDFSGLWLREAYLESARCPQFPTETSLPWLLMEQSLLRPRPGLGLQPVLSVLDVYNDAANCALHQLRRQVLFDEAEAEGRLCFDQMLFVLAEQVHAHCKREAKKVVGDSMDTVANDGPLARLRVRRASSRRHVTQTACPDFAWLADAKRVELFGESHNLTLLLAQHVHGRVAKDLEKWLAKLEASDATGLSERWTALQILRTTHKRLSRVLPLDAFDDMIQDVDSQTPTPASGDGVSPPSSSRLQVYASQILLLDLFEHFSYCARSSCFRRVPLPRELLASVPNQFTDAEASGAAQSRPRGPVFELDDDRELFGLRHVDVLLDLLSLDQVLDVVSDCSSFIQSKGKFKHVLECDELEAHVFHCLREVGNALAFLLLLSDALDTRQQVHSHGPQRGGVLRRCLQELDDTLHRTGIARAWHAAPHSRPERMPSPASFYHVWHALEFLACVPRCSGGSARAQFGDGVQLAGCAIIHVLGQRPLYELWHVNRHVLSVWRQEQTKTATARAASGLANGSAQTVGSLGREMRERAAVFAANALEQRRSTEALFHILETTWPRPTLSGPPPPPLASTEPGALFRPPPFAPPRPASSDTLYQ
ncbi:hypothetical protein PybrP1_002002 [[Pythium] brassicae (nom. inval.)]|nr:hypothetical protein PybrP1_002002 [[Pythium] brassicae (nom. inval.)]